MEAAFSFLPEFNHVRDNPVTTPMLRARHILPGELLGEIIEPLFQEGPVFDDLALRRRMGANLRPSGATGEIVIRFARRKQFDSAFDPDLTGQGQPIEDQRSKGIFMQFTPFATLEVGEKNKPELINPFEQNHPR